jgi:hypothetical protein
VSWAGGGLQRRTSAHGNIHDGPLGSGIGGWIVLGAVRTCLHMWVGICQSEYRYY